MTAQDGRAVGQRAAAAVLTTGFFKPELCREADAGGGYHSGGVRKKLLLSANTMAPDGLRLSNAAPCRRWRQDWPDPAVFRGRPWQGPHGCDAPSGRNVDGRTAGAARREQGGCIRIRQQSRPVPKASYRAGATLPASRNLAPAASCSRADGPAPAQWGKQLGQVIHQQVAMGDGGKAIVACTVRATEVAAKMGVPQLHTTLRLMRHSPQF
jgi:hypothetical protein